jgi:predicted dehydrogenase
MIEVGVIGLGNVGPRSHIPSIVADRRTELVAVADLDEQRLDPIVAEYDVKGYTELEAMLEAEDLDSIHICTPPQTHADIATTCLERGVAVLIEKPVAMNAEEVESLIARKEANDGTAGVIHNRLFYPHVKRALSKVRGGAIGDVVSIDYLASSQGRLDQTIRGDWMFDLDGGGMVEGLPHNVYLPLAFVDELKEVQCVSHRNYQNYDVVDYDGLAIEAIDTSNECLITIKKLTNTTTMDILYVQGTEGIIVLDMIKRGVSLKTTTAGPSKEAFISEHIRGTRQGIANLFRNATEFAAQILDQDSAGRGSGHLMAIEEFYDALTAGEEPPVSLEDGQETMRVIDAVNGHMEDCQCGTK